MGAACSSTAASPSPHHQAAAILIPLRGMRRDISVHRGLQRLSQHPPRAFPHDFINERRRAVAPIPST